ncbi:BLUF domain-containing protein [Arenibaculum pallidiluteum]|uniref:BLUF domain-containing protein n=1 Tax=Arenibaculum pallidiluteum TaxID=2812559 RepID=UPI001A978DDD|nr:BLUF domain-containing protein [Arenibaculum pallidiluteum]
MEMCLVYVSAATRPMGEDDLLALLRQSRRNNERTGVTGLLLYMEGRFMQALEGEQDTVLALYRRIAMDARHRGVTTLIKFAIPARSFPDWSMGFADIDGIQAEDRAGFSPFLLPSFDDRAYADSPHQAIRLLQRFRDRLGPGGGSAGLS